MDTATLIPATGCRPREVVVEERLPELLAAFTERDDLRRQRPPFSEVIRATERLERARAAIRGC